VSFAVTLTPALSLKGEGEFRVLRCFFVFFVVKNLQRRVSIRAPVQRGDNLKEKMIKIHFRAFC